MRKTPLPPLDSEKIAPLVNKGAIANFLIVKLTF